MIRLAIHGGAGTILRSSMTAELQQQYEQGLQDALQAGYSVLQGGGLSLIHIFRIFQQFLFPSYYFAFPVVYTFVVAGTGRACRIDHVKHIADTVYQFYTVCLRYIYYNKVVQVVGIEHTAVSYTHLDVYKRQVYM